MISVYSWSDGVQTWARTFLDLCRIGGISNLGILYGAGLAGPRGLPLPRAGR